MAVETLMGTGDGVRCAAADDGPARQCPVCANPAEGCPCDAVTMPVDDVDQDQPPAHAGSPAAPTEPERAGDATAPGDDGPDRDETDPAAGDTATDVAGDTAGDAAGSGPGGTPGPDAAGSAPGGASGPDIAEEPMAGGRGVPGSVDLLGVLGAIRDGVTEMAGADWHRLPGRDAHEALDTLELIGRQLAAVRSQVLGAVDANGLWALEGARSFASWLRLRTDTTAGAAAKEVREFRALRDHLPLTAAALEAGQVGRQHVAVLVREAIVTQQLRTQLREAEMGEAFLVTQAAMMDAGTFTQLVKAWAIRADPQAADRNWREADAKEELSIAPTTGGYHVRGWLDDISGQVVNTALGAHMGRKAQGDDRTASQRRAAALVALAHQSLDTGLQGAGARVRPHVTVTTSLDTLRALAAAMGSAVPTTHPHGAAAHEPGAAFGIDAHATLSAPGGPRDPHAPNDTDSPRHADGPQRPGGSRDGALLELSPQARAWVDGWRPGDTHVISTAIDHDAMRAVQPATLEDGTPLAPGLLARLVCESALSRVVFGPHSTVLDVGREQRIFPANHARAIIARDRHCRYPGCHEPPGFGEIHHSLWWGKDHGPTDVEHGILLCWHHHDWVHAHQITIVRTNGSWHFNDRNGRHIPATHHNNNDEPDPTP